MLEGEVHSTPGVQAQRMSAPSGMGGIGAEADVSDHVHGGNDGQPTMAHGGVVPDARPGGLAVCVSRGELVPQGPAKGRGAGAELAAQTGPTPAKK